MSRAYLLTGSNLGDRRMQLEKAGVLLQDLVGNIAARSPVYETAAWGKEGLPAHLNQALCLETSFEPLALLQHIQRIEQSMGRIRDEKWGIRCIDIDIIYFDDRIVKLPQLQIPHPLLAERRFALVPLADIAANYSHPLLHRTTQELLEACKDPLPVHRVL